MTNPTALRIVHGNPTPEEIAVIAALASARGRTKVLPEPTKLSTWGDPRSHTRKYLAIGPNAWRQSAWAKF